jgi:CubicO group peptidase (beta-lactamase class C family)
MILRKITRACPLFLCLLFFTQTGFSQSSKVKEIDAYLDPFVQAKQFSGVVLVMENGKVIYEKAFGLANADFKIPNQLDTRIGIASITKPMTLAIVARMVETGKISLADKLSKYIPDFPNGDKITVGMLANHRSGIRHRVTKPEEEAVSLTSAEMVEKIKKAPLLFEPGMQYLYSSAGFAVLARTLEIASGKSYAQLLDEYVFTPAGMKDSVDFNGEMIMERRAQDYILAPTGYINAPLKDYSFLVGGGSVFSTARDLYKFTEAVLDGKLGETAKSYLVGKTDISSNGSTNGHRANFKIERGKKWGYVLVSNLNSGANDMVLQSLEAILQGKQVAQPVIPVPKIIPNPNKNLEEFTGSYRPDGGGTAFEVFLRNNVVLVGDLKLYPVKTDCFFEYRYYGTVCFTRDDAGKIRGIEWVAPGFKFNWLKQ